jgi:hypothetical protein
LLLATSQLAVEIVNRMATRLVTPRRLPRMDYSAGSRRSCARWSVPTLLTDAAGIEALVEAIGGPVPGNRDAHLHFGLLTDFRDAAAQTQREDDALPELRGKGSRN